MTLLNNQKMMLKWILTHKVNHKVNKKNKVNKVNKNNKVNKVKRK
tara:strand:- start:3859 stop:3993 length:135 start_codon:yes stop_codon:yes gene_type:complete